MTDFDFTAKFSVSLTNQYTESEGESMDRDQELGLGYEDQKNELTEETLNQMSYTPSIEDYPYFSSFQNTEGGWKNIVYSSIRHKIVASVPRDVLVGNIEVIVNNGMVQRVDCLCKKKAEFWNRVFDSVIPPHIAIVTEDSKKILCPAERDRPGFRGRTPKHPYPLKWIGRCIENRTYNPKHAELPNE